MLSFYIVSVTSADLKWAPIGRQAEMVSSMRSQNKTAFMLDLIEFLIC